jgi:hypothetical protein
MPENRKPVRVPINVMRARLTVIGFNIAVVSFQIAQLGSAAGGLKIPGLAHAVHPVTDMELYMALALSVFALFAFIMSSEFDEVGVCTHWSLVAGDLLMYMAMAHTLAGFFAPLAMEIKMVAGNLQDKATEINILQSATIAVGGGAWSRRWWGMVSGDVRRTLGFAGAIPFSAPHQHRAWHRLPVGTAGAVLDHSPGGTGGIGGFR